MKITKICVSIIIFLSISISYITSFAQVQQKMLGCEGDSQTAIRSTTTEADTYCHKVAAALGWNHVNWSVGGSTSTNVVSRLPSELAGTHVDCLLVMIGANDAYAGESVYVGYPPEWTSPATGGTTVSQFQANLVTINNIAHNAGVPWTYLTPWAFWSSVDLTQFPFYIRAAENTLVPLGVPYIDLFHLQQDRYWNYQNNPNAFWSYYETDYQHPNGNGHTLIANEILAPRNIMSCANPGYVFGTPTPTVTVTPSNTPTSTSTVTPSITPTFTPTPSSTPIPSDTLTPSETPVMSATPTMECITLAVFSDGAIKLCK